MGFTQCNCIIVQNLNFSHADKSEEAIAVEDLINNGANLMKAVECLLKDIHFLKTITSKIVQLLCSVSGVPSSEFLDVENVGGMKLKMQPSDLLDEISSINTFLPKFSTFFSLTPLMDVSMSLHSTHDLIHLVNISGS